MKSKLGNYLKKTIKRNLNTSLLDSLAQSICNQLGYDRMVELESKNNLPIQEKQRSFLFYIKWEVINALYRFLNSK